MTLVYLVVMLDQQPLPPEHNRDEQHSLVLVLSIVILVLCVRHTPRVAVVLDKDSALGALHVQLSDGALGLPAFRDLDGDLRRKRSGD